MSSAPSALERMIEHRPAADHINQEIPMKASLTSYVLAIVTAGVAALGGAAAVYGEFDDAPGLVLIGMVLVIGAVALGVRTAQRGAGTTGGREGATRSA